MNSGSYYKNLLKFLSYYNKMVVKVKRNFHYYPMIFKNWYSIIYQVKKGKTKDIEVIFKNGIKTCCTLTCIISITNLLQVYGYDLSEILNLITESSVISELNKDKNYSEFLFLLSGWIRENNIWYNPKFDVKVLHPFTTFIETFISESYKADVHGKEVIDIGANVGDTALYFAINGAKRVYSFEPLPSAYKEAVENIRLNNLEDRIVLFNAGVGSKDGMIKVPSNVDNELIAVYNVDNQGDVEVPIYSLEKIAKEIVKEPYMLKMDCEGCEADVILNTKSDMFLLFDKIIFEHHYYITKVKAKTLMERLEKLGFRCKLRPSFPWESKNNVGLIYCEKK